jgi:flagellar biosynthetic protein FliR
MSADLLVTVQTFFLMLVRLLAVFSLAPVFSVHGVPNQFKIGIAFFVAMLLWPLQPANLSQPLAWGNLALLVLREALVGAAIGFTARLVVATAEIAGAVADLQIGFRASSVMNPMTLFPSSEIEQLYFVLACLLFLLFDGHHALLRAMAESYRIIPLGGAVNLSGPATPRLEMLVGETLVAGCRIALPVLAVSLLLDVTLALLSRAVPQVQVFFVGMPLKFAVGMAFVLIGLPGVIYVLRQLFGQVPEQISWVLRALAG